VYAGVTYWEDGNDKRFLYQVNLIALNAITGKLIPTFGVNGKLNLPGGLPGGSQQQIWYQLSWHHL